MFQIFVWWPKNATRRVTKIGVTNVSLVTPPNKSWTLRMQFVGGGSEQVTQGVGPGGFD